MKRILILLFISLIALGNTNAQKIDLDKKLGKENAQKVVDQFGIYQDAAMTAYVDAVGQRLVSHLDSVLFDYEFHIIPSEAPNAFALPGGYVYLTTGIIPLLQNEDELACILGHEIIHANNRHSVRQMKKKIIPAILMIPGNIIGIFDQSAGALLNAPLQTSSSLLFASYSRKFETEADEQGIALAAKAGYDPNALAHILTRMSDAMSEVTGNKETKSYFSDHPYTPDRNKDIEKIIANLEIKKTKPISANFIYEFEGIMFGKSVANGIVRANKFLHPEINFYIEFPEGWKIDNQAAGVGAYSSNKDAALFLTTEKQDLTPETAAKQFISKLNNKYKSQMDKSESMIINGNKAYIVRFHEKGRNYDTYAYALWIVLDKKLFRFVGMSSGKDVDLLKKSVDSFRSLTASERKSIMQKYLAVVKANSNESLESLSKRYSNLLKMSLTAIINDKKPEDKLNKGDEVKIVLERPYKNN
jgi:predicted Zn-dependent protease